MSEPETGSSARFDLNALALSFPPQAQSLLLDRYLVNRETASARLFRVYRGTPPHYHLNCDEFLYVLSGRGTFWIGDAGNGGAFEPGHFLSFARGTVHALPEILEEPVVFLSIDTPRREPGDIHFVHPGEGTPKSFIQGVGAGC
jgi:mannose-6-phosphate isomerase-like protein (cupin superfamily)